MAQPNHPSSSAANSSGDGLRLNPDSTKKRKISEPPGLAKERLSSIGLDHSTDDDSNSVAGGRGGREGKRTRVHFSCVECHRRKQKCDRKEPCSQCVVRKVPHLCRPFLNGVEDPNSSDVHARLGTIESLLNRLLTSMPQGNHQATAETAPDLNALVASGEEIFHPRSANPQEVQRREMPHKPPPSGQFPPGISYQASGRSGFGWGVREGRMINLTFEENPELRDVIATLKESGISKSHLEWLIAGVPGRRMADGLVDLYFRDIDWTRYKMNKPSFMRKYNVFFDSIGKNPTNPRVDADTLKWLPLMYIVLAIATLSAPNDIVPSSEQASWSRRFYGSARSGLEYSKALQRDNLDVLFAGLLASRYMLLTRRPAEGSTPLTTAFQLGLYRDGNILNLADKREIEIRRRAWSMLYHLDRTIALLVGRPASISDAHTDTRLPANLDDEELESPNFDPAGHPLTHPTVYSYVIVRHKLAEIMGRIAYHTFAIQLPDYSTVLNLDKELLAWRESLPAFFSMSTPDTTLDRLHPYLFVQRHLLACEWFYTRITLNRPYLLRRKPQDERYTYSKNAAIESATADLLSRRSFIMEKGNLVVNSGGYRVLNSYMVLGVTIKLDPDSPQADKLRHLLNVVSGRVADDHGRISEPLVKEELAIVEFLTAKTKSSAPDRREDQAPADLLLNLAKTRSGRRAAEEEKRQISLQQARELVEQQNAQKRGGGGGGGGMTSPWGYVPPSIPGLDVQQPFGDSSRRQPRPLQPPPSKNPNWSPEMSFGQIDLVRPQSFSQSPEQQQQQQQSQNQNQNQTQGQQPMISPRRDTQLQISPYQAMAGLPMASPITSTSEVFGNLDNQFTNAFDNFDFADLGLSAAAQVLEGQQQQFNPFALPQTEDGNEGFGSDDETQFLNYILTKFANSQPEVQ